MTNIDAYLILNAIPGLGPKRIKELINHFGSALEVLNSSHQQLSSVHGIPEHAILNLVHFSRDKFLLNEYNLIRLMNVQAISYEDERYPQCLREVSDAPIILYVRGNIESLCEPAIAVVGSRRASLHGINVASRFSTDFAQAGISVVSGLARGIDTAAHQGVLKADGITVAVLGCGLSHMYPVENEKLARAICQRGAVISEFPMQTPPMSFNFPRRNRIISGLSLGVLVVEAARKSGALITSDFALEQGREVYAVPGNVGDLYYQGTNGLIQQGAKLVTSIEDVLQDLGLRFKEFLPAKKVVHSDSGEDISLSSQEQALCSVLCEDAIHIDELADKTGMSVVTAAMVLFKLELKKLVKKLPGQSYQKIK